jgi:hypothetical protein
MTDSTLSAAFALRAARYAATHQASTTPISDRLAAIELRRRVRADLLWLADRAGICLFDAEEA